MYFPFLRGKQYELVMLREQAALLGTTSIHPVIEPVRPNLTALERLCKPLIEHGVAFTILTGSTVGSPPAREELVDWMDSYFSSYDNFYKGLRIDTSTNLEELEEMEEGDRILYFHAMQVGNDLIERIAPHPEAIHLFAEEQCGKLYRKRFSRKEGHRVLVRDGFEQRRNRDYPLSEHFSDLHATYPDEGMDGFGDYSIVGEDYSDTGGPAHAVAIHVTYLSGDDDMHICHFLSERRDSPIDPGGKFLEALDRMKMALEDEEFPILKTKAIVEFMDLHKREHFPGLGYVKKLSMQHHTELIANYLGKPR